MGTSVAQKAQSITLKALTFYYRKNCNSILTEIVAAAERYISIPEH